MGPSFPFLDNFADQDGDGVAVIVVAEVKNCATGAPGPGREVGGAPVMDLLEDASRTPPSCAAAPPKGEEG